MTIFGNGVFAELKGGHARLSWAQVQCAVSLYKDRRQREVAHLKMKAEIGMMQLPRHGMPPESRKRK